MNTEERFGRKMTVRNAQMHNAAWTVEFPNGYGASVITGPYTYGGDRGLFEVAVLHDEALCYATPVTSDVIGFLPESEVSPVLTAIADLPENTICDHGSVL